MEKISFFIFLLIINFYFSQSKVLYSLNHDRLMSNAVDKIGVGENADDEYEGTPFLNKEFLPSIIKGEQGTYLLRYNIYNDEIILKQGNEYFKIPKEGFDYFNINNKYIIRLINGSYYIESSSEKNNYVIVRKENIKFIPAKISENTYGQNRPSKFLTARPDYFFYDIKKKALNSLRKEELKILFPDKSVELDIFFKKNKLRDFSDFNTLLNIIN